MFLTINPIELTMRNLDRGQKGRKTLPNHNLQSLDLQPHAHLTRGACKPFLGPFLDAFRFDGSS